MNRGQPADKTFHLLTAAFSLERLRLSTFYFVITLFGVCVCGHMRACLFSNAYMCMREGARGSQKKG